MLANVVAVFYAENHSAMIFVEMPIKDGGMEAKHFGPYIYASELLDVLSTIERDPPPGYELDQDSLKKAKEEIADFFTLDLPTMLSQIG